MDKTDHEALAHLLVDAYMLKGRPKSSVSPELVQAWVRALPDVRIDFVARALHYHARDAAYPHPPTPADVLVIIRERTDSAWPSSDEAWSVASKAMDEAETVVWTTEMAEAWGIAQPIMMTGDQSGARLAFRDAYRRLVRRAEELGKQPRAWVSLGHDAQGREHAIEQARAKGLLTHDQAKAYLPDPGAVSPGSVKRLLGSDWPSQSKKAGLKKVQELLKTLSRKTQSPVDPKKAAEIEARRQAAAARVSRQKKDYAEDHVA